MGNTGFGSPEWPENVTGTYMHAQDPNKLEGRGKGVAA